MSIKKKVKKITKPLRRTRAKSVGTLRKAPRATDTSGLTTSQRRTVADVRANETKKIVANSKITVGNKQKVTDEARNRSGGAGSKSGNRADLMRSSNKAGAELKAKNLADKKRIAAAAAKKKAAENKTPVKRKKTVATKKKKTVATNKKK